MFKKCPSCKETKAYSEYYLSRRMKNGIQVYCKVCCNVKDKAKRESRKTNGPTVKRDSKECQKCHNIKPIGQFPIKRDGADGHLSYCKPCWVRITRLAQLRQAKT